MTLKELVQAKAREAAEEILANLDWDESADAEIGVHFDARLSIESSAKDAMISLLNECGFREALGWMHNRPCGSCEAFPPCEGLDNGMCNGEPTADCTCPCHTAEQKLKEIESL